MDFFFSPHAREKENFYVISKSNRLIKYGYCKIFTKCFLDKKKYLINSNGWRARVIFLSL